MGRLLLSQISLSFGDRDILTDVHLQLEPGRRISLAGANGSGKTTLLKIAAGIVTPDAGAVSKSEGTLVGYLPQTGVTHAGRTLREEAEEAFASVHDLIIERDRIGEKLQSHSSGDHGTDTLVERFTTAQERIDASGYYTRDARIDTILRGLGFEREDFSRNVETFSGGWQMRIALAKLLLENPDILLLDEPTNYLDIEARDWLRSFIAEFEGAVMIVAHDRDFLDHAVNETAELYMGALTVYRCPYTEYERRRATELDELVKRYDQQQEEIAKLEDFIRRFRYNSSKAAMVQSRVKMLEKMERIEIPENLKRVHLNFPEPAHSGKEMVRLRDLAKRYDDRTVLRDVELMILRGEKVAITGHNGAGKTTLLRIVGGHDTRYEGVFELGTGVQVGYFGQDVVDSLSGEHTVLSAAEEGCPTELIPQLRSMLGAFLFRDDDVFKPVNVLSGGEKSRLAMLRLLLAPYNLLVLDEPTNHLDMSSQDVLLDALRRYSGTVLIVSHDRDFLRGLASRVIELTARSGGARLRDIPGDFEFYEWKIEKEQQAGQDVQRSTPVSAAAPRDAAGACTEKAATASTRGASREALSREALSREERKELQRDLRRLSRECEKALEASESCGKDIQRIEQELSLPENYSDGDRARALTAELDSTRRLQEEWLETWEAAEERCEELRSRLGDG